MKNAWFLAGALIFAPFAAAAQDAPTAAPATASYIEGGKWTYPSMNDIYRNTTHFMVDVMVDCAVLPTGHVSDCLVNSLNTQDKAEDENAVAATYQQRAVIDSSSVDGGIQVGDRVRFHYMWNDLPRSDLAGAAKLPKIGVEQRRGHDSWTYPNGSKFEEFSPGAPAPAGSGVTVVLYCAAHKDGTMKGNCHTLVEIPDGYGYGDATIQAVEKYGHVDPGTPGDPVQEGDYVLFTYHWNVM